MKKSDFVIEKVEHGIAFVIDLNTGSKSVTNDIENVFPYVISRNNCHRMVYRDSEGEWFEAILNFQSVNGIIYDTPLYSFEPWHGIVHDLLKRDY